MTRWYCRFLQMNDHWKAYAAWWLWARLAGWTGEPRLYCTAKLNSHNFISFYAFLIDVCS